MPKRLLPVFLVMCFFTMRVSAFGCIYFVKNVQPIPAITVAYGTPLANIDLPTSAEIILNDNTTRSVKVRWSSNSYRYRYNPLKPGTYSFTGRLTMPPLVLNPLSKTASIKVTVTQESTLTVSSVSAIPDITVKSGTALASLGLPPQVTAILSDGTSTNLGVLWDSGTPAYNKDAVGSYVFSGKLNLTNGITNPQAKTASVKVAVAQANSFIPNSDPNPQTGLNTSPGSTLFEFDSLDEWLPSTSAKLTQETGNVLSGTASVSWSALAPVSLPGTGYSYISAMTSGTIGNKMAAMENMELGIYVPDTQNISYLQIRFYTNNTRNVFYQNDIGAWELSPGWNKIRRTKADYAFVDSVSSGAVPSWENITNMEIMIVFSDLSTPRVGFDRMAMNTTGKANLLFTFDDAWYDIYKNGFPVLEQYGFKATTWAVMSDSGFSTIPSDQKEFMDETDLDQLYNSGWDIGNHTVNHPDDINLLTDDAMRTEYLDAQNWLLAKGWERGAYHVCYPTGSYNERLIPVLKGIGVKSARTVNHGIQPTPVTNIYKLKAVSIGRDTTLESIYYEIDRAVATGSSLFFMLHRVEGTPEPDDGGNNYGQLAVSTENLRKIAEYADKYVQQNKLDVTTISQWYDAYMRNY